MSLPQSRGTYEEPEQKTLDMEKIIFEGDRSSGTRNNPLNLK